MLEIKGTLKSIIQKIDSKYSTSETLEAFSLKEGKVEKYLKNEQLKFKIINQNYSSIDTRISMNSRQRIKSRN